jgi:hypothetical protein
LPENSGAQTVRNHEEGDYEKYPFSFLVALGLFGFVSHGWSACEGDTNCDGVVDGLDLAALAADFGTTGCGTCENVLDLIQALESRIAALENKTPKGFNARRTIGIIEQSPKSWQNRSMAD